MKPSIANEKWSASQKEINPLLHVSYLKFCKTCYAYKFCGVCLFHINDIDKVDAEEFVCDQFQDQTAFKNKLHRIFSFLEKYPNDFAQILESVILE